MCFFTQADATFKGCEMFFRVNVFFSSKKEKQYDMLMLCNYSPEEDLPNTVFLGWKSEFFLSS